MLSTTGFRMIALTLALAVGPITALGPSYAQTPG